MSTRGRLLAGAWAAALLACGPVQGAGYLTEEIANAVKESTVDLGFRYRFEAVEDDAFAEDAWASTLRTRLTVAPQPVAGFGVLLEVDDVRHVGAAHFNDTRNGETDRPGVADPEGTDLNQALVRYSGFAGTDIVAGRRRIERNNQRFVGGVGWRQNEQTFDGAGIAHQFGGKFTASYAWVSQVNRIHGPDDGTPPADFDSNTHLLDASYVFSPAASLAVYGYWMDFDNAPASSNRTTGARLTGAVPLAGAWRLPWAAEFARQGDYGDNPVDYDASYYLLEAGIASERIGLRAGYEVLEGDTSAGAAFRTPLATLHAFQGWADKFLATPDRGIEDIYVAVNGKALGADLLVRFHDFSAETGGGDWGTELDFSASWAIAKHYAVMLKGATYDADEFAQNTSKYWLMLSANF
jgi:hypothetical protein